MKRFILDSSKGLAEVTASKQQKVQFIHESVRDFLLKEDGLGNVWPDLGVDLQGQSQERLKQCCLNYLSQDLSVLLGNPEPPISVFPFLEYAVRNVLYHADAAAGCSRDQRHFFRNFRLSHWVRLDNLFEKFRIRRHTEKMSLLYILGERNMPNLIKGYSSGLSCLEAENERYGPPVFAAMAAGSKEAIRIFMESVMADLQPGDHNPWTRNRTVSGRI